MTVYDNISFGLKNIKEELPVMDIELKTTSDVIRSLQNTNKPVSYTHLHSLQVSSQLSRLHLKHSCQILAITHSYIQATSQI